jgi:hypothetical protein
MSLAPSFRPQLLSIVVGASVASMCGGVVLGAFAMTRPTDPCAVSGIDTRALSDHDRSTALHHALACSDYEHGRISLDDFHAQTREVRPVAIATPAPVQMQWASTVRAMSTQYSPTQWSAKRALGAPDVYPVGGDNGNAWASTDADAASEFLEVGFAQPTRANGVDIYETYNPGAVTIVDVITADGSHHVVYQGVAAAMEQSSYRRQIQFEPIDDIVAVRVTLDSAAVPGWNEIDAIGLVPAS